MDAKRILNYLKQLMANNNREWYWANKTEYDAVRADFEEGVKLAIGRIAGFDPSIAHLSVKDCTYRFNRDTRFSPDKSPYKNHFGAYIAAHGKKALHGGYYLHLEPGHCMVACGNYWLPTNILTSCRNEIMANADEWLKCVENKTFQKYFGSPQASSFKTPTDVSSWDQPQGFGLEKLKTCPSGFPSRKKSLPAAFPQGEALFVKVHNRVGSAVHSAVHFSPSGTPCWSHDRSSSRNRRGKRLSSPC
jgi:uncharacterized protein (TIGR02453 family)